MQNNLKQKIENRKQKTNKEKLLDNIRRVEGQINGIEKMVAEEKNCLAIVQQISAVRSALSSIAVKILAEESCNCRVEKDKKKFENVIKNLLNYKP